MTRIFISYRTSDGVDKATALARELNAVFGDEQVFLDKEDLPAGQPWREAIGTALDGQPILLLLITPQVLGPRLQDADDPVRREVAAALEFGAHVIPLLGDGVAVGCNSVLNPGTIVGARTQVYTGVQLRSGAYPADSIVKLRQALEIVRVEQP